MTSLAVTTAALEPAPDARAGTVWLANALRHHFQPIVDIATGQTVGCEALLRGCDAAGFGGPGELFSWAAGAGVLFGLDLLLRERAVASFLELGPHCGVLFYNLDRRTFDMSDYHPGATERILAASGLPPSSICYELSEQQDFRDPRGVTTVLREYRTRGLRIALDDFGNEYSSLRMLYHAEPDFVKIDRFFIAAIAADHRKRLFVSTMVRIAHTLGVQVVAEGVETAEELLICRDLGCDLAQGYFIQVPTADPGALQPLYPKVPAVASSLRAADPRGRRLLREHMTDAAALAPLRIDTPILEVFDRFSAEPERRFFPVVDERACPLGIVREVDIKEVAYSRFGRDLLRNPSCARRLRDFVRRVPVIGVGTDIPVLIDVFAEGSEGDAVLVTEHLRYAGVVDATVIVHIVQEQSLTHAREENPVTRLPGNDLVAAALARALESGFGAALVHFDFDFFKPFNDRYGFRHGDRVIQLFANLLRKRFARGGEFVGHIGGDDFILVAEDVDPPELLRRCTEAAASFAWDVQSFYDADDRQRGWIAAVDRDGRERRFPLLSVSAGVVFTPPGRAGDSSDDASRLAALLKKAAKVRRSIVAASLLIPGAGDPGEFGPPTR